MFKSYRTIAIGLVASLTACETPYSLSLGDYDEQTDQKEAVITVSDPQIYARGTLVNDRLKEKQLLDELIEESQVIEGQKDFRNRFTPQLVRDLSLTQALAAQFSASYDQSAATEARRENRLEDLRAEIREYELLGELEAAKRALQALITGENGSDDDGDIQKSDDASGALDEQTQGQQDDESDPTATNDAGQSNNSQINALNDRIDLLGKLILGENGSGGLLSRLNDEERANTTTVNASPLEQFRDLNSYRSELRQRQSEINLDDLHDFAGNMLYRLQFGVSVLPPPEKDRLGVVELSVEPTPIDGDDIERIYNSWLAQIAHRLNQPRPAKDKNSQFSYDTDIRYRRLESAGLFRIVDIEFDRDPDRRGSRDGRSRKVVIRVPVRPSDFDVARDLVEFFRWRMQRESVFDGCMVRNSNLLGAGDEECEALDSALSEFKSFELREIDPQSTNSESSDESPRSIAVMQMDARCHALSFALVLTGLDSSKYMERLNPSEREQFRRITTDTVRFATDRFSANAPPETSSNGEATNNYDCKAALSKIPSGFKQALTDNSDPEDKFLPNGKAYTYSVSPIERSQRLSTISKNANSLDLALAAAVGLQRSGVDASMGTRFVRQAEGNVEARERTPIVVAFAGHTSRSIQNGEMTTTSRVANSNQKTTPLASLLGLASHTPYPNTQVNSVEADPLPQINSTNIPIFGWVFAPPVKINAKKGRLEHAHFPTAYRLAGDISVPGWWPSVDVGVNTKWVKNWGETNGRPTDETQGYRSVFSVNLPLNSADLDALTNFLSYQLVGLPVQQIDITDVEPEAVSACQNEVEILIAGANVWRSSEVFLGGLPAKEIRVLPDMEGIAASFDLNELSGEAGEMWKHAVGRDLTLPLKVWTRNGHDETSFRIISARRMASGSCFSQPGSTAWDDGTLDIIDVSPSVIDACAKSATLVITTDADPFYEPYALLNGKPGTLIRGRDTRRGFASGVVGADNRFNPFDNLYSYRFDGPFTNASDLPEYLELTYVSEQGSAKSLVGLRSCKDPKSTKTAASGAKGSGNPAAPIDTNPKIVLTSKHAVLKRSFLTKMNFNISFRLASGEMPSGPLKLRVRPATDQYTGAWFAADSAPIRMKQAPDLFESTFTVENAPTAMKTLLINGAKLKAELLSDTGGKNNTALSVPSESTVVLYEPEKDDATVDAGDISNWTTPFKIEISMPEEAAIAYGDIEKMKLVATTGVPGVQITASDPQLDGAKATIQLSISQESQKALRAVFASNAARRVDLRLRLTGGDVPSIRVIAAAGKKSLALVN